jgi:hypothetical protein
MILDSISWRIANNVTRMNRDQLLEAAMMQEVYVHGFDKEGHAVIVFAPTMNDACPTALAVDWI